MPLRQCIRKLEARAKFLEEEQDSRSFQMQAPQAQNIRALQVQRRRGHKHMSLRQCRFGSAFVSWRLA